VSSSEKERFAMESQAILDRIGNLRKRLESPSNPGEATLGAERLNAVAERLKAGSENAVLLDGALRRLSSERDVAANHPTHLTHRTRRVLEMGRTLLERLRALDGDFAFVRHGKEPGTELYRATLAMAESALRTVSAFPDAPSVQLQLCHGIEATLDTVKSRVARLEQLRDRRRRDMARLETLASFLQTLSENREPDIRPVYSVAESVLSDCSGGAMLRMIHCESTDRAVYVAAHGLNVAHVMARVIRKDPVFARKPLEPIVAALVHDVGMLAVESDAVEHAGRLSDEQKRLVEGHTLLGAEKLSRAFADKPWMAEAAADHHERIDGSGYPAGLRDNQLSWPVRLLAVCDVFAAACSPRPHRSERTRRAALSEILQAAERGSLDRHAAERILALSFYPPGTVVELSDGAIGVVVAVNHSRDDLQAPFRPVVSVLMDGEGNASPIGYVIDLAECETQTVTRSLTANERRQKLAEEYPEFV
jgi:HD-GYP domain-containing protein (c-di-GMP phosphodiesterase class II)